MRQLYNLKLLGSLTGGSVLLVGLAYVATPDGVATALRQQQLLSVTPDSALRAPLPMVHLAKPAALSKVAAPSPPAASPAVKVRPITPVAAVPKPFVGPPVPESLMAELAAAAKPMVVNPLAIPSYEPFKTSLEAYFRLHQVGSDALPPVYLAALHGDTKLLRNLINSGHQVDDTTPGGDTPLCAAIWHGHEDAVQLLLASGANPERLGREEQPPLALASLRRNTQIMRSLLKAGAAANCRFNYPVSKSICDTVLIKDLRNSLTSDRGVTPLIACAARGDVEGASLLLKSGAKANVPTTKEYRYPINFAATQGYLFLMRVLLGRPADEEPDLLVTVDLSQQKAWIARDGEIIDSTSISSGRSGYATPQGRYVVTDKHASWTSNIYHVAMPYFMRLNCSAIGLHQGHVTGRPASHGCIRLPAAKAKSFFYKVKVGDEVQIIR
jgi:hypothetical protein